MDDIERIIEVAKSQSLTTLPISDKMKERMLSADAVIIVIQTLTGYDIVQIWPELTEQYKSMMMKKNKEALSKGRQLQLQIEIAKVVEANLNEVANAIIAICKNPISHDGQHRKRI